MTRKILLLTAAILMAAGLGWASGELNYPIVDTGQDACFDDEKQTLCPEPGQPFNGQDSQYKGNQARYQDNDDGTVTDLVTGLMWVRERGEKHAWQEAVDGAADCRVGGYDDWRAPTIKELYSLIDFNGYVQRREADSVAFLDTNFFGFAWGDTANGERIIDCQDWSATRYQGTAMGNAPTAFGVNFCDGRIKGYPSLDRRGGRGKRYIRYVRGNLDYGKNHFVQGKPGTVEDHATGLVWQQADDGLTRNWEDALAFCESLELAGRDDWRLPNAKELQSIVDYTRSPTATDSAAIDPIFSVSNIESYFWTSTTHMDGPKPGEHAVYIAFGRAMGYFSRGNQPKQDMDVHGAGAQRSDPKTGTPKKGFAPQGDDQRIQNYVRCVTGGQVAYYVPPYSPVPSWKGGQPNQSPTGRGGREMRMNGPDMGQGRGPGMQQGQPPMMGQQNRRQGPPPEAYTACESLSTGDDCTVDTPRGALPGICRDSPDGILCVPDRR